MNIKTTAIMIAAIFISSTFAWPGTVNAIQTSSVQITSPTLNQVIYNSTVVIAGTYAEHNSTNTPTVLLQIDGGSPVTLSLNGNSWSDSITLGTGWHRADVSMKDWSGIHGDSMQFEVISGPTQVTKYHMILIVYSEACQRLLSNNITSACPTLDKLAPFDTTNQTYAGKIVKLPNGEFMRTKPLMKEFWAFFKNSGKNVVCIDCDFDFAHISAVPYVMIEPNYFAYPQIESTSETQTETYWNGTQDLTRTITIPAQTSSKTISWDRYVSSDCMSANEIFDKNLLADTIAYIDSGCTKTNIVNTATLKQVTPSIDYEHSQQIIYQKWVSQAKKENVGNCITEKCAALKNPFANSGYATGGK